MIKVQGNSNVDDYNLAKKVYYTIYIFSFGWLLLIFLAPILMELGGVFEKISAFIYFFFSKVCHQNDIRSFYLLDHKLTVCSRCVWIYLGFFLATSLYPLKYNFSNFTIPPIILLISASAILFLDIILDELKILENTFFSRSVTGFIIGFVLPLYIIPGFVKFFTEVHSFLRSKVNV